MSQKTLNPKKTPSPKTADCLLPAIGGLSRALSLSLSFSLSTAVFYPFPGFSIKSERSRPASQGSAPFSQRIDLQRDRGVYGSPSSSPATSLGCARRRRRSVEADNAMWWIMIRLCTVCFVCASQYVF
jgi:hypothetical protein